MTLLASQGEVRIFSVVLDCVTSERMEILNITDRIRDAVGSSSIRNGFVHIQSLHTTTSIFINEWQQALLDDMKTHLSQVVPRDAYWRHNDPVHSDCERKNADSHLRGMVMGQSLCLQVRNSAVVLGTWQQILLAEFDGPRNRTVSVQGFGI